MASKPYNDSELLAEPTLDEMLADPMVQLVMQRDGVKVGDMRGQIDHLQRKYTDFLLAV